MRVAEERAQKEGKVLRDGAVPLMSEELTAIEPYDGVRTSLFWNFVLPVIIVITVAVGSFKVTGSALTMEAFLLAAIVSGIIMRVQGIPLHDITDTAMSGIKGIMPAIIILAFAYALNDLSRQLQTAQYIVSVSEAWLTPGLLPLLTFLIAGIIAFSTGTSWGTYGIMMPIAVPIAFAFTGGELGPIVFATVAAIAGGGVFGDPLLAALRHVDPRLHRCGLRSHRSRQDAVALCAGRRRDQRRRVPVDRDDVLAVSHPSLIHRSEQRGTPAVPPRARRARLPAGSLWRRRHRRP